MTFKGSISDIVPHDAPMLLLDRFVRSDENTLVAEVDIGGNTPFFEAGSGVPSYVGMEYMAQAIAAFNGLKDYRLGQAVKPGFLLGSRNVTLNKPYFEEGCTVSITVTVSFNDGEMAVFDGSVQVGDDVVASARINAFQPKNPEKFIQTAREQHSSSAV
ncbi:MAG: hypothetical protein V7727_17705 [Sneathiella sp.]